MYSSISENKRNTVIIFMVFIAIISGIGLYFSYIYKNDHIFLILLICSILYSLVQYNISKTIVLYMNGAKPVSRDIAPGFYAAAETISITAGLPMPKLYIIDDDSPNAFAAGTNPEKAIICTTTGLLNIMDKSELEAVVAHEMSHIKNYDIRVSMAAVALTSAIELISEVALRIFIWSDDENDNRNPLIVVLGLLFVMISPLLALITRLAISRQREFLADATAVSLTRYPEGMIRALQKLKNNEKPLGKQNSTTANLFIVNPMKRSFFQNLFSTHPSIDDRISRLKDNSSRL